MDSFYVGDYTFCCVMKREIEQIEHINITSIWWLSECRNGINNNRTQWSETFTRASAKVFVCSWEIWPLLCISLQIILTASVYIHYQEPSWENSNGLEKMKIRTIYDRWTNILFISPWLKNVFSVKHSFLFKTLLSHI